MTIGRREYYEKKALDAIWILFRQICIYLKFHFVSNRKSKSYSLRKPEELRPEQYQQQLDQLIVEYSQLQERTEAVENVNREGGKFIREAKVSLIIIRF